MRGNEAIPKIDQTSPPVIARHEAIPKIDRTSLPPPSLQGTKQSL
ncbi:hypothetical protein ACN4EE_23260 [Geminocystis sp. CENA526]